jgi:heme A synthase
MNIPLLILIFAAPIVGLMLTTLDGPTSDRWFGPPGQRNEVRWWCIGTLIFFAVATAVAVGSPTSEGEAPTGCINAPTPYGDC